MGKASNLKPKDLHCGLPSTTDLIFNLGSTVEPRKIAASLGLPNDAKIS